MDSTFVSLLSEAGIASAVVVALMIFGILVPKWTHDRALEDLAKKEIENERLREALALERQRSDATTQSGAVTLQLIKSLVALAGGEHHEEHDISGGVVVGRSLPAGRAALDLGPEDVGL